MARVRARLNSAVVNYALADNARVQVSRIAGLKASKNDSFAIPFAFAGTTSGRDAFTISRPLS